jgi:hypothetical protein
MNRHDFLVSGVLLRDVLAKSIKQRRMRKANSVPGFFWKA